MTFLHIAVFSCLLESSHAPALVEVMAEAESGAVKGPLRT
jgi:hypothetical protein